jgi:hypothetical protein
LSKAGKDTFQLWFDKYIKAIEEYAGGEEKQ